MDQFFHGSDTLLLLLIGALAWFFKSRLESDAVKHEKHFAHSVDMTMHETEREREAHTAERKAIADELIRHQVNVDKRFERINDKLDEILKAVNR